MLPEQYAWIAEQFEPEGDPWLLLDVARTLEADGNLPGAATVLDRAFGIAPEIPKVREVRQRVLDRLAVVEHGLTFRYVPAGPFLMGCPSGADGGAEDERPRRPVWLSAYWLCDVPVNWAACCRLMGWGTPQAERGMPRPEQDQASDRARFFLWEENKIRFQYCEDHTTRASGWHSHVPGQDNPRSRPRRDSGAEWSYEAKPMVAVSWQSALELASRISSPEVKYSLPSEAQWEKAARGGLIGARYPWGDELPSAENCDFGRFHQLSILPARSFSPNGYGLYAMSGCVWEWTADWYDARHYEQAADVDPCGPAVGEEKVLRGGSWADCAEVVTVTFRMALGSNHWRDEGWGRHLNPNVGFRLCRTQAEDSGR